MRLLVSFLLIAAPGLAQHYDAPVSAPGWARTLRAYGLLPREASPPALVVLDPSAETLPAAAEEALRQGQTLILTGHSPISRHFGIQPSKDSIEVRQARSTTRPSLPLIWAQAEALPRAELSSQWHVDTWERWTAAPLVATRRLGAGALLWTATTIGEKGYEKFPFLPQALRRVGVASPARARNLSAFFDASHRLRADLPYLAARWREAGISVLHVTSWQFDGASPERATWLARLIDTCHEHGIAVYAWLELPHVSDRFWDAHPQCREKTLSGADAHLDWRRLINLVNPACSAAAEASVLALLRSYDWDGVNLGELYFESLEGYDNPTRFTPFSADALAYFEAKLSAPPLVVLNDPSQRQRFLDARASLAADLQNTWLAKLATLRAERPDFDLMLTHIDDRFDTGMRNALGADSARLLASTEGMDIAFLIEDPATVWHLGPERYQEIRRRYHGLTREPRRLAIDLNIVERYQDVYPTKQQTGVELLQLVHQASQNFDAVALYFEASLQPEDLPLLAPAAARLRSWRREGSAVHLDLAAPAWIAVSGPVLLDGVLWPIQRAGEVLVPSGTHELRPASAQAPFTWDAANLGLEGLEAREGTWLLRYSSRTQAWISSAQPFAVTLVNGQKKTARLAPGGRWIVSLPRGDRREVTVESAGSSSATPLAGPPVGPARN